MARRKGLRSRLGGRGAAHGSIGLHATRGSTGRWRLTASKKSSAYGSVGGARLTAQKDGARLAAYGSEEGVRLTALPEGARLTARWKGRLTAQKDGARLN